VPATVRAVIEHPDWPTAQLGSLRLLNMGSSVVPQHFIRAFLERGVPVVQVYGATETGPVSIVLRTEDATRAIGSTGKAALHCDVRLVDQAGADVAAGSVGEIWLRAKNMMIGYWKDPHNPAFQDGWFHTGDLARMDEQGFYWVVGRSKEMIISGGENIYPAEIENILAASPAILECAVVGRPDAKWGEVAVAVVVRASSGAALEVGDVLALLEGKIARYKHPREIRFVESLPKTALGKVQKSDLIKLTH
jgi:fatty-acyl-CoA synthase